MERSKPIFLVLLFWSAFALTAQASDLSIVKQIQMRYQEISSFEGKFLQRDVNAESGLAGKASGTIAFLRPGKMKWDYHKPNEQLLVTDGTTLWLFDPLLENVTVQDLEKVTQGTPLSFLLGAGDLESDFEHRPLTRTLIDAPDTIVVELKPKHSIAALDFIQLAVNPNTFDFSQIVLVDLQGNHRVIEFQNLQYNTTLEPNQFHFEITPGMEVIYASQQ